MRFNEEVLGGLLKRGIEIEENNIYVVLRLFMTESDITRRKALYEILRDCEFHKSLLAGILRNLKFEMPAITEIKDYGFEDMLIEQKVNALRNIKRTIRDFYKFLLDDIRNSSPETFMDEDSAKKLLDTLDMVIKGKEEHLRKIERLINAV